MLFEAAEVFITKDHECERLEKKSEENEKTITKQVSGTTKCLTSLVRRSEICLDVSKMSYRNLKIIIMSSRVLSP